MGILYTCSISLSPIDYYYFSSFFQVTFRNNDRQPDQNVKKRSNYNQAKLGGHQGVHERTEIQNDKREISTVEQ